MMVTIYATIPLNEWVPTLILRKHLLLQERDQIKHSYMELDQVRVEEITQQVSEITAWLNIHLENDDD